MGFTNLWPLFLLITIPLLVLLYILKRKYREEVISSTLLWNEVYKNTRANTPWEKLRKNIMLLLQIIILLLLILSLMRPFLNFGGKTYKNIILVIDNTASMSAEYGDGSRLEEAKRLAKEVLSSTKDDTNTYIISFDGNSNLLQNGDFNKEISNEVISSISQSYNTGEISESLSFVKAIGEGIEEEYEVIAITDKDFSLGDVNGKVVSLANSGVNASIDNISHKFLEDKVRVIATITNRGSGEYSGDFSLYDGEELISVETLDLKEGENKTLTFDLPSIKSEFLRGELSRKDMILEDNTYNHVIGKKKVNKVLIVTEQNLFLEKAFASIQNTEVYKTNSASNLTSEDNYDLYVFDNVTPDIMPSKGSILFINPSSNEFFNVINGGEGGEAKAVIGEVSKYLEETTFTAAKYNSIEIPYYGRGFLNIDEDFIGFKGEVDGRKIAALSFDLHNSDFPLKKEFPILMYELGENLISSGMIYKNNFKAGEKIIAKGLSLEENISLTYPNGDTLEISSGDEIREDNNLGIYKLEDKEEKELFSVNFPSEKEGNTNVNNISESENIANVKSDLKRGLNISPLLIILAMAVVAFEWIMYKKGN
ncbi:MAG: BatA and WFA domain-containing protein [Clostridium sp.]|uniref:vWA domain-containing protein n=1 Tax=Clostridium sp. TaxID=1506 RepID=UPI002A8274D6|nr:BatA and WFA domain-containing protein [Clostridium sp.]MCI6691010.1 BatA and WFA domain-containing protein [Clostridium sp.]MDY4251364.1 BatA and WFA domain-containing protein [Clostridium sp.]